MITPPGMFSSRFRRRDSATNCQRRCRLSLSAAAFMALLAASLPTASAQSAGDYKEPDYTKFKPEEGQITLEFWSWVGGLDKTVKDFEQAFPNIKIHVNNVGGGPAEYEKLQTALKAGSGAPDVAQVEYDFLPSFMV
jgi:multiple sugar transport system substrate-binding protein